MNNDVDSVVCPECGGDVRITAGIEMHRRGWAWVLPKAIVGLMILSILALSLPGIRSAAGIGFSARSSTTPSAMVGAITPDPAISLSDVREMLGGDVKLKLQIIDSLDKKLRELDGMLWEGRVRFVGGEPKGIAQQVTDYGFFVSGCRSHSTSYLFDVRDRTSWDTEQATPMESAVIYWPYGYLKQSVAHGNAYMKNIWFDYIDVVAVIASVWLVVWVVGVVLGWLGVSLLRRPGAMTIGIIGLLGVYVLASAAYPHQKNYLMVTGKVGPASDWISYEKLMDELDEEQLEIHDGEGLCSELGLLSQKNLDADLVLGIQLDYGHDLDTTRWWVDLGSLVELSSGSTVSMMRRDDSTEESVVKTPNEFGRGFDLHSEDGRFVVLKWTDDKQVRTIRFEPMAIALLLASVLWIWKLSHWAVRVWVDHQTRKRVRQNQCIFCAYPLSEEAQIARSLANGS